MTSISGSGARILAILDLFTEARPDWTPEDLMATLGYSRPTLYRYLKTLKDAGYLTTLPGGPFALGPKVTELDFLMRRADPMILHGSAELAQLAAQFPGTAFLSRWYGGRLLCVASVASSDRQRSSYPRGRPMPIGRGAISRAIAAHLPPAERRRIVQTHLADFAGAGVGHTRDEVMATLRTVRRDGVAVARGEVTAGIVGIAAPILASEQTPLGALCFSSDEADMAEDKIASICAAVRGAAGRINAAICAAVAGRQPQRAVGGMA